jgi:hypothetical protein
MEHLFNFGSDFASYFLVVSVATNKFLTFFATKMSHVRTTSEYFACASNLEAFHDDLSGFLFLFGHIISWVLLGL